MNNREIDNAIAADRTYADKEAYHKLFAQLRREDPVHWTEPDGYRPFWTVSKFADVLKLEKESDKKVSNAPRRNPLPIKVEQEVRARTGKQLLTRSMLSMDGEEHAAVRGLTLSWFTPINLQRLRLGLGDLAKEFVDRLEAKGGKAEFVDDIAARYPLRVIMGILGIPREDEDKMLKLTRAFFAPNDVDAKMAGATGVTDSRIAAFEEFGRYFAPITAEKRRNPTDDLISVIANGRINDKLLEEHELLSYYITIVTAGHDTTASSLSGGLLALMQNPDQFEKLRANPEELLSTTAPDEVLRWVAPVSGFFRTALEDYELRGTKVKAGEAMLMCYPSANRDEEVFKDPFAFDITRAPNKQLSFGQGVHVCLGQHLAKMEIKAVFGELLPRIEDIALDGTPAWTEAFVVPGLKRLPVRYSFKKH